MRGRLFALVAIAVLLMAGVGAVQSGYRSSVSESQPEQTVTNETFLVSHGSTITLAESNRDDDVYVTESEVTVRQNNQTYPPAGNWSWNRGNGTLDIVSGSGLTNGNNATVTYGYHAPTNEQQLARDVTLVPVEVLGGDLVFLLGLFVFMAAFVVLIRIGGM